MAEKQTDQKPPIVVTPTELVGLYERLHEREWNGDKQSGAYKNPVTVMRSAVHYGRLAAARLVDAFARLAGLEGRQAALEGRIAALEEFKRGLDVKEQAAMAQVMAQIDALPPAEAEEARQQFQAVYGKPLPAPGTTPAGSGAPALAPAYAPALAAAAPVPAPTAAPEPSKQADVVPIKPKVPSKADGGAPGGAAS